jgi:hypothetical protein
MQIEIIELDEITPETNLNIITDKTICSGASFLLEWYDTTDQNGYKIPRGADGLYCRSSMNLTVTPKPADIITDKTICSGASFWNGTSYTNESSEVQDSQE